jgi:hypothetical protein
MSNDPQSPYRRHLKDRRKIIDAIPDTISNNNQGGIEETARIGSLFSQTVGKHRKKRPGQLDDEDKNDLSLFGYNVTDGATVVNESTYTYDEQGWHE